MSYRKWKMAHPWLALWQDIMGMFRWICRHIKICAREDIVREEEG